MIPVPHQVAAQEAAALWGGQLLRAVAVRENAIYELALPGGGRAALRLHRPGYQPDAAIRSELWWCAALAARGVAVPRARPALTGDLLGVLADGRRASVVDWLEGAPLGAAREPFSQPLPQLLALHHALGALLAQVQRETAALALPADFTRPRWDRAGLVGEAPFWGRFWEHPGADADQRALLLRARDFLAERLAEPAVLGPIHADVLRENVLVQGETVSLIDFDDSGIGFRLYDLGTAMSQSLYEPDPTALRDALMDGYGTADAAMVEAFTLARCCASVGWMMPRLAPEHPVHRSHLARFALCARRVMGG
jgi:Ser/Thr protein kinase RdoA (MazF antagonist)